MDPHFIFKENFTFSQEDYDKCRAFANQANYSEYFRNRNQRDLEKCAKDSFQGKLGEICAYRLMQIYWPSITAPDFTIYPSFQKSWNPDMMIGNIPVHVKCQGHRSASEFGASWLFQWSNRNGRAGKDMIFVDESEDGWVVFVLLDEDNKHGFIKAIVIISDLRKHDLFQLPFLNNKKKIKRAIYLDSDKCPSLTSCNLINTLPREMINAI